MAEEFIINSRVIEDKINQLLPSQGGFGTGLDFSASTMVIPIVDLTEAATGSSLRVDLQSSLSLSSVTAFSVNNATTTLVNTTGYFRVYGNYTVSAGNAAENDPHFDVTDGTTTKKLWALTTSFGFNAVQNVPYDFLVLLQAGESLRVTSSSTVSVFKGVTRQIADINGNLTNP